MKKDHSDILLHHPLLWSTKLYYIIFISTIISILLVQYHKQFFFKIYQLDTIINVFLFLTFLLFAYWIYKQKYFIQSKDYGKFITKPWIEFQVYFVAIFFFFLPTLIILNISHEIKSKYNFTKKEKELLYYDFKNNRYEVRCDIDKDGSYTFNTLGEEVCYGDKELLDKLIVSLNLLSAIDEINEKQVDIAKKQLKFISTDNIDVLLTHFISNSMIIFAIWIIIFKHNTIKDSIYMVIYLIVIILLYIYFIYIMTFNINFGVFFNKMIFLYIVPILLFYIFYIKKKKKYYFFLLVNYVMFFFFVFFKFELDFNMNLFSTPFFNDIFNNIPFFILISIFITPMVNHVIYLKSQPI